jgi:sugar lactone lactonase YvrE
MWVDSAGRAYVTEMGFDIHDLLADPEVIDRLGADWVTELPDLPQLARIFIVDPDGSVREGAPNLRFPNGIVVDEQRGRVIVAETLGAALTFFDLDKSDGSLTRTDSVSLGFSPDGIAVDGDGNVWVCDPVHARAWLVDVAGIRLASVVTQQLCVACALGGERGTSLYLCTAPATNPEQCLDARGSRIEVVDLDEAMAGGLR